MFNTFSCQGNANQNYFVILLSYSSEMVIVKKANDLQMLGRMLGQGNIYTVLMVVQTSSAAEISIKMAQKAKPRTTKVSIHSKNPSKEDKGTCTSVFTVILVTKARNVVSIDAYQLINSKCGSLTQWSLCHFQNPIYIN